MKHLLDASSFLLLIKKADANQATRTLQDSTILDLTFYEVGNAIWKESSLTKLLTQKETEQLGKLAQMILAKISVQRREEDDFQKILETAQTQRLTFYDSSYIYYAKKRGLQLNSEDRQLRSKAQKYVKTCTVTELLQPTTK